MNKHSSRRSFLASSVAASAAAALGNKAMANNLISPAFEKVADEKDLVILFQGDSITDGNRGRNADPNHIMAALPLIIASTPNSLHKSALSCRVILS